MKIHFIGIGGTGMGALAGLLSLAGHEVRGSDAVVYPPMSTQLARSGIEVFRGYGAQNLAWDPDVVVVGNACRRDHVEVVAAQERGLRLASFPSLLGETLLVDKRVQVVAGTHGKTTTTSALAWFLLQGHRDPSFLIGGVPQNLLRGFELGRGDTFVIEGDEYDTAFFDKGSKFLHYRPSRAILTSVEYDHVDIFASFDAMLDAFRAFVRLIPREGELFVHADDAHAMGVAEHATCKRTTFRVLSKEHDEPASADYCARIASGTGTRRTVFRVYERGNDLGEYSTALVGRFNVANLLAAFALARSEGVDVEALREGIRRFRGVRRRQELIGVAQGVRVIDDFAHHPTAVEASIRAVRQRYPENALHACFEPRSASSRRAVFAEEYARSFDAATSVYIGPLFGPDAIPVAERLDVAGLAQDLGDHGVSARAFPDVEALTQAVIEAAVPGDTVLVLSSGSFDGLPRRILHALGDAVTFATPEERDAVDTLLESYSLPKVDRSEDVDTLVIADEAGIGGCVSLEAKANAAFLFGLAVRPDRRREGLGWVLGDCVLRHARTMGARTVYLITGTAADFFGGKLGFQEVDLDEVDPSVRASLNFAKAAAVEPAVFMVYRVPDEPVGA